MTSTLLFFEKYTYYFKTSKCVEVAPVWLHRFESWNFIEFLFSIRLFKVFYHTYSVSVSWLLRVCGYVDVYEKFPFFIEELLEIDKAFSKTSKRDGVEQTKITY